MFFSTVLGGRRAQPCAKTVKTAALVPSLGEGDGRRLRRVLRRSPGWKCLDVSNDERPTERNAPETKKHSNHLRISSFHSIQIHFCIFISFYSHSLFRIHFSRFRMEQKETKLRRSIQNHGESQRGLESTSNYHGNDGDDDHCHQLFVPWYYKVPQSLLSPKVRIP